MSTRDESQVIYDIRQYADYKRAHTDWKDIDGGKYLEHVEALLDEIAHLQARLDNQEWESDERYEKGYDEGYKNAQQESYTQGHDDGFSEGYALGASDGRAAIQRVVGDLTEAAARLQ